MNIPVSDVGTRNARRCYVERVERDIVSLKNTSGGDLVEGDFLCALGLCGVLLENIASNAYGDVHVEQGVLVTSMRLVSGKDTFATLGQKVYYDPVTKAFADQPAAGFYEVGKLYAAKTSAGEIKIEKLRYATAWTDSDKDTYTIELPITSDGTGTLSFDTDTSFTIVDAFARATASNASGTATVKNSAGTAITNAMTMAVDKAIGRATSIDPSTATITDQIVKVTTNGAADRGVVTLIVRRT